MSESADHTTKRAVVLLSGGLDSVTALAVAQRDGYECHALSFDYGQRHKVELAAAQEIADAMGVASHRTAKIDLRAFGGSALTDDTLDVPKDRDDDAMSHDIPVTYVPARNTIFLSYALALAEVLESTDLFIGVNAVDYSGYPDCRPEFIASFERTANLATKAGVTADDDHHLKVHTPLIDLPKTDIIRLGLELGVDYSLTHSCYDPLGPDHIKPCGHCDACLLRIRAFEELGQHDPAMLRHHGEAWKP
ncbi:7-cyano-7-deazaguanine synthase QueC [Algisphaera agarilytica]|uniref:7-cyano-7-deazaguanine synthase n=1 Tax=Algisphaera agarilytica TaxID=1385975 RepID=A0A7X0H3P7_9BACT|nr:7-cyano-7-deazaguanine synthase QueC [Algisphaera agarilytica]MBB6428708.1 7-cyano-7-deazaguanine synthase [Algisphaera agarilytica]